MKLVPHDGLSMLVIMFLCECEEINFFYGLRMRIYIKETWRNECGRSEDSFKFFLKEKDDVW